MRSFVSPLTADAGAVREIENCRCAVGCRPVRVRCATLKIAGVRWGAGRCITFGLSTLTELHIGNCKEKQTKINDKALSFSLQ